MDNVTAENGYEELRALLAQTFPEDGIAQIDRAYAKAKEAHKDQKRQSGEPYIIHPIAVA